MFSALPVLTAAHGAVVPGVTHRAGGRGAPHGDMAPGVTHCTHGRGAQGDSCARGRGARCDRCAHGRGQGVPVDLCGQGVPASGERYTEPEFTEQKAEPSERALGRHAGNPAFSVP